VEFAIFIVVMIIVSLVAKAKQQGKSDGRPNPRVQKLIDRMQAEAQRNGGPPLDLGRKYAQYNQPQYNQPQVGFNQPTPPPAHHQPPAQYQPPAQFQPPPTQFQPPAQWLPSYGPPQGPPPGHRPPQHNLPTPRQDTDTRVRELMGAGNEVAAIRLLCDEQDMGILEAQKHARALVAPAGPAPKQSEPTAATTSEPEESETRYVGSAAFAESIFDLDREEDTWASGWVDTPEPEDRSDIDELWQTVRNAAHPGTNQSS
jgi:hypothetical protein